MRLSEGNPFKTCANPQRHNQKLNKANRYENEMVETYRNLNCSGASPMLRNWELRPQGPSTEVRSGESGWGSWSHVSGPRKVLLNSPKSHLNLVTPRPGTEGSRVLRARNPKRVRQESERVSRGRTPQSPQRVRPGVRKESKNAASDSL